MPGLGEPGGFGGGAGAKGATHYAGTAGGTGGGGGGLGAGGDIFVAGGGVLTVDGGLLSGGAVAGGSGAADGAAYATGIFLQGNETITLSAAAGTTLTIDDQIADQTGAAGKAATPGTGALAIAGSGTVLLAAANSFHGGIAIQSGTLDLAAAGAAGSGAISFAAPLAVDPTLEFAANLVPGAAIENFGPNDTIEIAGFLATGTQYAGGVLTLVGAGLADSVTLNLPGLASGDLRLSDDAAADLTTVTTDAVALPCFLRGTRILTERGPLAVENLAVGDRAITAAGAARPIVWLGHRTVDTAQQPHPQKAWPIRVCAGAFGAGLPGRDLWLSPDHAVAAEGVLIPVRLLVNGRTIRQVPRADVEYWHVELDAHDILFAEGLPAESYLDTGNRAGFQTAAAPLPARADRTPKHPSAKHWPAKPGPAKHWSETCRPLAFDGPAVERARRTLLAQAERLGHVVTDDHDLHLLADGSRLDPIQLAAGRFAFALPAGAARIELRSHDFVPAQMLAASTDRRRLGACIGRLQLDGRDIALDDAARFGEGWHAAEHYDGAPQRWTDGAAHLPPGTRRVVLELAGPGRYWRPLRDELMAAG
jgi:autotransporter-associated beta strand protein